MLLGFGCVFLCSVVRGAGVEQGGGARGHDLPLSPPSDGGVPPGVVLGVEGDGRCVATPSRHSLLHAVGGRAARGHSPLLALLLMVGGPLAVLLLAAAGDV